MDYTTLAPPAIALDKEKQEAHVPLISLYEALQLMPDPRRGQGKRYPVALLLCLLLLAKLAEQTRFRGATEWSMDASLLSLCQAPASRMLELVRKHWGIENRLHWRRAVTLGEDACQTRTGGVPSLLARLNSTVLSLMDCLGVCNVARQARYLDAEVEHAIQPILTGQCSVF